MTRPSWLELRRWLLIAALLWPTVVPAAELEEALARTAAGDLGGAEAIYRDFAQTHPAQGLPALGRFLSLTASAEKWRAFRDSVQRDPTLKAELRAKIFLQSGQTEEALAQLRPGLQAETDPETLRFAADVFARAGAPEAGSLYLRCLHVAPDGTQAKEALHGLLPFPEAVGPEDLPDLARWFLDADLPPEERLTFLDGVVRSIPAPGVPSPAAPAFDLLLHSVHRFALRDDAAALAVVPETFSRDPAGKLWAVQRIRILSRRGAAEAAGEIAAWLLDEEPSESPDPPAGPDPAESIYPALARHAPEAEAEAIQLIHARPYDPEPMRHLMRYYRETGKGDPTSVPMLVSQTATNPQVIGHCGYVLATEGFPERALPEYDRALELDPTDPFLQMNRAACLTRLERWDEAQAVYRHLLETGHQGRPYHLHELVLRLWVIAETRNQEQECLDYFRALFGQLRHSWHSGLAPEVATVMEQFQRPADAEQFRSLKPLPASP